MNHVDRMKEVRKQIAQKAAELRNLNYAFSAEIPFEELSNGELDDLLALQIGESTYANDCDVTRTA